MENVDVYTINGIDYEIVDILEINNVSYAFMTEFENPRNLCIERLEVEDGNKVFVGLKNEEEYDLALKEFYKKYKDLVS